MSHPIKPAEPCRAALTLLLCLPLLAVSCGHDTRRASRENFAAAIQADFKRNPRQLEVCTGFPSPVSERQNDFRTSLRGTATYKKFEVLRNRGYLTIQDMPATGSNDLYIRVAVTDKFIKDFGEPRSGAGFLVSTLGTIDICYATAALKEVTDFTAPSDMMGMKVSQVDYTLTHTMKPDMTWLKDQQLLEALNFRPNFGEAKAQAALVLKDSGWVVTSF